MLQPILNETENNIRKNGVSKTLPKNPTLIRVLPTTVENPTTLEGISKKVFLDRYSLKDESGNPIEEYPEQMFKRVAKAIAQIEKGETKKKEWEEKFYHAMEGFKFVPGGRILAGAGTGYGVTFYNCYVLPSPKDSRDGILSNLGEMVEIMARGGGVGINLSSLRPKGARVKKVNGFSSGPVNWAGLHSLATRDIIQQGGTRRGALMIMLWDWHPDIEEFITIKQDLTKLNGANLSVCVSDRFMEAVKKDEDWPLLFPDLDDPKYDTHWDGILENWIASGGKINIYKTVRARKLWDLICQAAWASAEPGLHFMERSNKWSNNYYFNRLNCTNPCGEEPLPDYGVCNLGSLNLANFVNTEGELDYKNLAEHAKIAVRFQDNVIDGDIYVLPGIVETQLHGERRIGLGTMGLGDALIKMKLRYGSEESVEVIEKIYKTIRDAAYESSSKIAKEKGSFPKFDKGKYLDAYFIKQLPESIRAKISKTGIRNSVLLMQAPTGSTSLMCSVTSGIEPVYEFSFIRRDRIGEHKIYHSLYQAWGQAHPGQEPPSYFVSANDLTPEEHIKVQAAVQKYVDASISKTVNAPNVHTIEDVKKLYTLAYELGCKGVTYMRDGSREGVLTRIDDSKKDQAPQAQEAPTPIPLSLEQKVASTTEGVLTQRPEVAHGATYRIVTPLGSAFITINEDEGGEPLEVFINIGKAGSDVSAMATALGRLLSTVLRLNAGVSRKARLAKVIDQLVGIGGRSSVGFGPNRVSSLPDAVARALARHFKINGFSNGSAHSIPIESGSTLQAGAVMAAHNFDPTPASADMNSPNKTTDICPECGAASLVWEEGCAKCYSCGHAEC